jgi:uncharacterized protein (DUF924 family)
VAAVLATSTGGDVQMARAPVSTETVNAETTDTHWEAQSEALVDFWLGLLDAEGLATPEQERRWFTKDPAFDEEVRQRFAALLDARAAAARTEPVGGSPRTQLASILLFDQLPRNMFRNTARMYAYDPLARTVAHALVASCDDVRLRTHERLFVYLPCMHSEDMVDQEECVRLFTALRDSLTGRPRRSIEENLTYAVAHRDIIARFGRFPHRNAILGRTSTEAEQELLKEPGSSL